MESAFIIGAVAVIVVIGISWIAVRAWSQIVRSLSIALAEILDARDQNGKER